jgi:hypothetical protein
MEGEQGRPPKLDYVTPATTRGEVSAARVVGGAILSILVIGVAVPIGFGIESAARPPFGVVLECLFVGAVLAGLHLMALWARRRPTRRGLAQGVWIGMGIAVLLEGVCFLMIA